jgi:hypothetical protein
MQNRYLLLLSFAKLSLNFVALLTNYPGFLQPHPTKKVSSPNSNHNDNEYSDHNNNTTTATACNTAPTTTASFQRSFSVALHVLVPPPYFFSFLVLWFQANFVALAPRF